MSVFDPKRTFALVLKLAGLRTPFRGHLSRCKTTAPRNPSSLFACCRITAIVNWWLDFTSRYRPKPRPIFRYLRVVHNASDYFAVTISHIVVVFVPAESDCGRSARHWLNVRHQNFL